MKTILKKISHKYNIPYDIIYIILEKYFKNNINESILRNRFKLGKLEENRISFKGGKYLYIMEKLSFNKFRYDEEILKKLINLKKQMYTEYNNKSYMNYFIILYNLSKKEFNNIPRDARTNTYYVKYII